MAENGADRLESWKEIAAFLGCDERTAMRYEKERGMPVQRVPGGKRGRVFASKAEIDVWLNQPGENREGRDDPESTVEGESGKAEGQPTGRAVEKRTGRYWLYGAIGVAGAFAILLFVLVLWSMSGGPRLPERVLFEGDTMQALDARGRRIWTYKFPRPPDPSRWRDEWTLDGFVRIVDLNGDGDREVLAVIPMRDGFNPDDLYHTEVDCFSSKGRLLWSYSPQETFQFGEHQLHGPWAVFDVFVSQAGPMPAIWVSFEHSEWGNSFVAQLDPKTGRAAVRFVNTGIVYKLNELRTARGTYLLAGGFNNEYEAGSLAIFDESKPFASSPQTAGTRHKCVSCPEGFPDYYFVFPRSEINEMSGIYQDPVRGVTVSGEEIEISKAERQKAGGVRTIYEFRTEPRIEVVSLRYDSSYDMLHRELSAQKKLGHSLDNCPERIHPKPVKVWTPTAGWTELAVKPAKATE